MTDQAWLDANRVRLWPGRINRWVIIVSTDAPDPRLAAVGLVKRVVPDIDSLDVVRVADSRINLGSRPQRRENLPQGPIPMVKSGGVQWVELTFVPRGPVESVPWPAERYTLGLAHHDPIAADAVLDSATTAQQAPEAPPPKQSEWDKITETAHDAVRWGILGLGAVGALVLYNYLRR